MEGMRERHEIGGKEGERRKDQGGVMGKNRETCAPSFWNCWLRSWTVRIGAHFLAISPISDRYPLFRGVVAANHINVGLYAAAYKQRLQHLPIVRAIITRMTDHLSSRVLNTRCGWL